MNSSIVSTETKSNRTDSKTDKLRRIHWLENQLVAYEIVGGENKRFDGENVVQKSKEKGTELVKMSRNQLEMSRECDICARLKIEATSN
jgi:hypothetical protein